jgi:beta-glucanase (GH16 family)
LEDRVVLSPPGSGWQMLWADEFNGTSLDTSKWAVATGPRRDAVNTASAISEGGGYLTITTYTSGGTHYTGFIGTYNSFKATYGYWEASIAFQDSPGEWSAFWDQSPTIGNPIGNPAVAGTEIDTVEHRVTDGASDLSNKAQSTIHWDGYGADHKSVSSGLVNNPGGPSLQGNFHLYGLQWGPSGYQFYIDGTQIWSTTQAVSHRSEFIYLSSEVQNNSWAGSVPAGGYGDLATSQTKMIVDYVRVWQRPVSGLSDRASTEGAATPALPFTVTQKDGATTNVSATSSNTYLLPGGSLALGGGGADRALTVYPAAGQTGYATVTVTANNGIVNGSSSFTLTVNAGSFHNGEFEDDATGTGWNRYGGAQVVGSGQRSGSRALRITGYGGAEQVITGLQPNTTYTLGGYARVDVAGTPAEIGVKNYGGSQLTATITGTSYTRGTVTFTTGPTSTMATVFAYKPTTSGTGYFDDYYVFRAPTLSPVAPQLINANATSAPIPFTLGNVSSAAGAFTLTATSSNQALLPNAGLALGGSGLNRNLTVVPAAGQTGTATITLTLTDAYGGHATRQFAVTVLPPPAAPWADQDVGAVGQAGSAGAQGGTYLLDGSGADVWNTADGFNFLSQPLTGNGEVVARVVSVANTDPWAKAGVMFRETLDPSSTHALVDVTPAYGVQFIRRTATGSASTNTGGDAVSAPYWVKLVRSGNAFTAYDSPDGVNWNWIDTDTIPMAATAYVGLAVNSHNNSTLNAATFDNVSVVAQVDLSSSFNQLGAVADGTSFAGGLDGNGDAYSANSLGPVVTSGGVDFNLGAPGGNNAVQAAGQTIALPQGPFSALTFLGTAVNGAQPGQTFIVYYTDGTSDTFTQDMSDWLSPQGYAGEAVAAGMNYYDHADGSSPGVPTYLYQYTFALNNQKTVSSITLPGNGNVQILALNLLA